MSKIIDDQDHLDRLVEEFIDSFEDDEAIVIGDQSLDREQLRRQIQNDPEIARRIREMVKRDEDFERWVKSSERIEDILKKL